MAERDGDGSITDITFEANSEPRNLELGVGQSMNAGMDGEQIFSPVFKGLINLRDGLESNDKDAMEEGFVDITDSFDNLLKQRADLGARINQLELVESRMLDAGINLERLKSDIEEWTWLNPS